MAQINLRIDDNIKKKAEEACSDMGLTLSSAIVIYLKKLGNERRIPFEITADFLYNKNNIDNISQNNNKGEKWVKLYFFINKI